MEDQKIETEAAAAAQEASQPCARSKRIGYESSQFKNCRSILELGPAFTALTKEFAVKAAQEKPAWYEKFAGILFMCEGKPYYVDPEDLETDSNHFACIADELIDALYALGAYEMFYTGKMD